MPEKVKWTMRVQIGNAAAIATTEVIAAQSYSKLSVTIPAGSVDKVVHILPAGSEMFSLLAIWASKYEEPADSSTRLRVRLTQDSDPIALSSPLLLTHGGALDFLADSLTSLRFSNNMQQDVEVGVLACSHAMMIVAPPISAPLADVHLEMAPAQAETLARNDLTRISGIGPVYQQRLYDAGIETFADLAAASVEQIKEIFSSQPGQAAGAASWIGQARVLASESAMPDTDKDV